MKDHLKNGSLLPSCIQLLYSAHRRVSIALRAISPHMIPEAMIEADRNVRRVPLSRLLIAAALVAALDAGFVIILYAHVLHVSTSARIMKGIASGLLGRAALDGGSETVALGVVLHIAIAGGWTLIYAALRVVSSRLRHATDGTRGAIVVGLIFGALVWLVMDLIVLPLSRARPVPISSPYFAIQLVWHTVGVGMPISLIVRGCR